MLGPFKYTNDSPFWYLLAVRVWEKAEVALIPIFDSLNQQASQLELPITYGKGKSLSWAVLCQLFVLSRSKTPSLSKMGFSQMMLGFGHAFTPNNFPRMGFERILGNISSPSFLGRTFEESVADTFLANGLTLISESEIDPSVDTIILAECLSDSAMLSLGKKAVAPPSGLWESITEDYSKRRPGFFRRMFTNTNSWLFDK